MFIGHMGLAFAAKKLAPRTSLGTMFAAAEALDFIWPVLVLAGVEHVRIVPSVKRMVPLDFYDYPMSHSLLMACVWGALFALAYWAVRRYRTGALVIGALVVSHWLLDAVVHRPDLPLLPWNNHLIGLGLWNHTGAAVVVEFFMFASGMWIYLSETARNDRIGSHGLWLLATFLVAIWVGNIFGPPPPNVKAIGLTGVGGTIVFVAWATWIDAHRKSRDAIEGDVHLFTEKHARI